MSISNKLVMGQRRSTSALIREVRGLRLRLERREMDAVFPSQAQFDLGVTGETLVEGGQGIEHGLLDPCDEGLGVFWQV